MLQKWARILDIREEANKQIERVREQGGVGSSLQAELTLSVTPDDHALLSSLGEDLKFIFITSAVQLQAGDALAVQVQASSHAKCERCWHLRADVGTDAEHPKLCGRCVSNLYGSGEERHVA